MYRKSSRAVTKLSNDDTLPELNTLGGAVVGLENPCEKSDEE